jgi:hypothetical protein
MQTCVPDHAPTHPNLLNRSIPTSTICTDTNFTTPNNYIKLYDYAKIYIAKVYINMVSVDIFVNTAVAYNQNTTTCCRRF